MSTRLSAAQSGGGVVEYADPPPNECPVYDINLFAQSAGAAEYTDYIFAVE